MRRRDVFGALPNPSLQPAAMARYSAIREVDDEPNRRALHRVPAGMIGALESVNPFAAGF